MINNNDSRLILYLGTVSYHRTVAMVTIPPKLLYANVYLLKSNFCGY